MDKHVSDCSSETHVSEPEVTLDDSGIGVSGLVTSRVTGDHFVAETGLYNVVWNRQKIGANNQAWFRTPVFTVCPGVPDRIDHTLTDAPMIQDGRSTRNIAISVFDAFNNTVEDGTAVYWDLNGLGSLSPRTEADVATIGGHAEGVLLAGTLPSDQELPIDAGGLIDTLSVTADKPVFTLTPERTVLLVDGQSGDSSCWLTLDCLMESGAHVPDGIEVTWFTSNGTVTPLDGGKVVNGQSRALLSASGADVRTANGGTLVMAGIPNMNGNASQRIPFKSSADYGLEVKDPVLVVADPNTSSNPTSTEIDLWAPAGSYMRLSFDGLVPSSYFAGSGIGSGGGATIPDELGTGELTNNGTVVSPEVPLFEHASLYFDGTSDLSFNPSSASIVSWDNFRLGLWVRPDPSCGATDLVEKDGAFRLHWDPEEADGCPVLTVELTDGTTEILTSTVPIVADDWQHIVMEVRASEVRLTVSGKVESAALPAGTAPALSGSPLTVGRNDELPNYIGYMASISLSRYGNLLAGSGGLLTVTGLDSEGRIFFETPGVGEGFSLAPPQRESQAQWGGIVNTIVLYFDYRSSFDDPELAQNCMLKSSVKAECFDSEDAHVLDVVGGFLVTDNPTYEAAKRVAANIVIGGGEGTDGMAADLITGTFAVGDIRDAARELIYKVVPGGNEGSWAAFSVSVVSIATTGLPGVDQGMVVFKRVIAKLHGILGNSAKVVIKAIVDVTKRILDAVAGFHFGNAKKIVEEEELWIKALDAMTNQKLARLGTSLLSEEETFVKTRKILSVPSLQTAHGKDIGDFVLRHFPDGTKKSNSSAKRFLDFVEGGDLKYWKKGPVLPDGSLKPGLAEAHLDAIAEAIRANPGENVAAGLTAILDRGWADDFGVLLVNGRKYDHISIADDFAAVVESAGGTAIPGLEGQLKGIASQTGDISAVKGRIYELRTAALDSQEGWTIRQFQGDRFKPASGGVALDVDIDYEAAMGGSRKFVQAKLSGGELEKGLEQIVGEASKGAATQEKRLEVFREALVKNGVQCYEYQVDAFDEALEFIRSRGVVLDPDTGRVFTSVTALRATLLKYGIIFKERSISAAL